MNFFNWPLEKVQDYPDCYQIVKERVFPDRSKKKNKSLRRNWWIYERRREDLYLSIAPLKRVLVRSRVADKFAFTFVPKGWVYNERLVIFVFDKYNGYAIIQSGIHEAWARFYGSTLKMDMMYNPSDCFETFPFPHPDPATPNPELNAIGETYHEHRRQIMLTRQEGLTATYNRFHNPEETAPDIAQLRALHVQMDTAVAAAYGWADLALAHDFYDTPQGLRFTISESARREVLGRLLALNHQRYEEEVLAGLHEKGSKGKKGKRKAKKKTDDDGQMSLF
jgi:hypothetical protein